MRRRQQQQAVAPERAPTPSARTVSTGIAVPSTVPAADRADDIPDRSASFI
jgi:hypothetical protein